MCLGRKGNAIFVASAPGESECIYILNWAGETVGRIPVAKGPPLREEASRLGLEPVDVPLYVPSRSSGRVSSTPTEFLEESFEADVIDVGYEDVDDQLPFLFSRLRWCDRQRLLVGLRTTTEGTEESSALTHQGPLQRAAVHDKCMSCLMLALMATDSSCTMGEWQVPGGYAVYDIALVDSNTLQTPFTLMAMYCVSKSRKRRSSRALLESSMTTMYDVTGSMILLCKITTETLSGGAHAVPIGNAHIVIQSRNSITDILEIVTPRLSSEHLQKHSWTGGEAQPHSTSGALSPTASLLAAANRNDDITGELIVDANVCMECVHTAAGIRSSLWL
jgi:hypothetical protein